MTGKINFFKNRPDIEKSCIFAVPMTRYHGRVARRRSAKPFTAVRFRLVPQKSKLQQIELIDSQLVEALIFVFGGQF